MRRPPSPVPATSILLVLLPGLAAAMQTEPAGSWEGEFETPRAPIFMTLHLEEAEGEWRGNIVALGRTFPLHSLTVTERGVAAALPPDLGDFRVDVVRAGDVLEGWVADGGERYPLTLLRVPDLPPPGSREEAWRQDLDALSERFLRFDRSFSPEQRVRFREHIDRLRQELPDLHDAEVMMRMAAAVALSENAHTRLYLLRNRTELRRLPVRVWWFADGLRVVRATHAHADLLGCRVDRIGGVSTDRVRETVSAAFAGNESWTDYQSVYFMTSPEALRGVGIAADPERIRFTFSDCADRPFERALEPLPLARSRDPVEAWRDLSPHHREEGWVQALEASGVPLPLYLSRPDRHYWFAYLEDLELLYLQYNRASEMADEGLAEFGERVLRALGEREVRSLVVDLRFNTGGDLSLARDLMTELERATIGIRRYVITGRSTFSAGISHVASWAEAGDVVLVGEPVGDELDVWSEGGNIILPGSGLTAHFANAFHSYSEAPCPSEVPCFLDLSSPKLNPHIPATSTWDEYAQGKDVALDAITQDAALQPFR